MIYINKKVAVCILTFNRYNMLKKTVFSILDSSFRDFQIIVFNDCSTDRTNEYLKKLQDEKIVTEIRHSKNMGQYNNANYVLDNLSCKYLMFLHDDDTVRPELLERKVELIEKDKDISMVGCGWNIINDNEEVLETRIYNKFNGPVVLSDRDFFFYHFDDLNFPWSGVLYNKEKIGKLRFEDKFDIGADYPFVARLAIGNKVGYIPEALYNYRTHGIQVSKARNNIKTNYGLWLENFKFYENLVSENFKDRNLLKKLGRANSRTMFQLAIQSKTFDFLLEVLRSRYFKFRYLTPVRSLKVIKKFFLLLFSTGFKNN